VGRYGLFRKPSENERSETQQWRCSVAPKIGEYTDLRNMERAAQQRHLQPGSTALTDESKQLRTPEQEPAHYGAS
jgi:hypothetical protein